MKSNYPRVSVEEAFLQRLSKRLIYDVRKDAKEDGIHLDYSEICERAAERAEHVADWIYERASGLEIDVSRPKWTMRKPQR